MSERTGPGLSVVTRESPATLPTVAEIVTSVVLRPGEFREPVVLTDPRAAKQVAAQALESGIAPAQALALLAEGHLLRMDVEGLGLRWQHVRATLGAAARSAQIQRRLSAADATYLRSLMSGDQRPRRTVAAAGPIRGALSVRVLRRVGSAELRLAAGEPLAELKNWEIAAVVQGRTLNEWAMSTLLASARP
jgi:hypothetical protein